ncbi:hypothetical protein EDEG_04077 [Edhazardia aedis USNM 41457]|uniref:Uncharacterized protein n=1 Tax=Edhazardia aedis (strain USNM 41457) TaxID=1003232 RepID=J9A098_EDHAE|nr:hypothetical protein EDEG_04077 [Edhazardia aedis USNM 41457]|eukprot:EJW05333.1 hypothetical protein EDEG_04077 [Edhazardia aedis USNM 41457]
MLFKNKKKVSVLVQTADCVNSLLKKLEKHFKNFEITKKILSSKKLMVIQMKLDFKKIVGDYYEKVSRMLSEASALLKEANDEQKEEARIKNNKKDFIGVLIACKIQDFGNFHHKNKKKENICIKDAFHLYCGC